MISHKYFGFLLAVFSGFLLNLIFPRWEGDILAWVALIPLLVALRGSGSIRRSFLLGLACGFVYFAGSCFWITNTMVNYGGLPLPLSAAVLFLLALYLALYVGAFSALFHFFLQRGGVLAALLLAPFAWTFLEFCRTHLFTGFPWNLLGYSQYRQSLVIQMADLTGVYGVSFFICHVNAFFYFCGQTLLAAWRRVPIPGIGKRESPIYCALTLLLFFAVILHGNSALSRFSQAEAEDPIRVSMAQGNISQDKKWDPEFRDQVLEIYKDLTLDAAKDGLDLAVWPETAVPFFYNMDRENAARVEAVAREAGTHLLIGSPSLKRVEDANRLRNSAYFISREGEVLGRYDKVKLVPFGEYVPLGKLLWFVEKMVVGIGDFLPGEAPVILEHPKGPFGVLICFEIIFPHLARWNVMEGARFLVNITNDAWFGESAGPYQHLSQSVFRAVENRVPILRSANTGISAVVNQAGEIESATELFTREILNGTITPHRGIPSFYSREGDLFSWLCGGAILAAAVICLRPRRKSPW